MIGTNFMVDTSFTAKTIGRHVVVLCHPGSGGFNHAVAKAYCDAVRWDGQEVVLRDLYAIGFDPVLKATERPGPEHPHPSRDVADELEIIRRSDVFVLVYPIWFGSAPAMLKGYVDRVLGAGVVPAAVQDRAPTSLLGGKQLLSITTSASDDAWLAGEGQQAALDTVFDKYLQHAFGMRDSRHIHFDDITGDLSEQDGARHLQDVKDEASRQCADLAARRAVDTDVSL